MVADSTTGSSQLNAPSSSEGTGSTLAGVDMGGAEDVAGTAAGVDGLLDGLLEGLAVPPAHPASMTATMTSDAAR